MSPQDAETIRDVFAKIRAMGTTVDDVAATRLVEQELRANPAATLNLVKVLVGLEQERDQFAAHIDELNAYIDQLEAQLAEAARGAGTGQPSGGLFGGTTQGSPFERGRAAPPAGSPWTETPPAPQGGDPRMVAEPSPWARTQPPAPGPWGQPAPQPQGSGFWGSALRTGAGVAGGLLAVEAVKGMFGGGHDRGEGHGGDRHGFYGSDREAGHAAPRDEPRETSGGFGGEAPERGQEPIIADNIDFFGGGDDDGTA